MWFHTVFKEFMHGISKVRAKRSSMSTICSLGQVKFSFDKYMINYGHSFVLGQVSNFAISTPLITK